MLTHNKKYNLDETSSQRERPRGKGGGGAPGTEEAIYIFFVPVSVAEKAAEKNLCKEAAMLLYNITNKHPSKINLNEQYAVVSNLDMLAGGYIDEYEGSILEGIKDATSETLVKLIFGLVLEIDSAYIWYNGFEIEPFSNGDDLSEITIDEEDYCQTPIKYLEPLFEILEEIGYGYLIPQIRQALD